MTNTNCLEGIRCPRCGQEEQFKITATITCLVDDDGSDPIGDHDWDNQSFTHCPGCGFGGTLPLFRPQLPGDPDGMNARRSEWAGKAIAAFREATGADEEDALGDLLGDLMHWCDRHNYDFGIALDRAKWHYGAETGGEES